MKTFYVVFKRYSGAIEGIVVNIVGKVNHLTIQRAVQEACQCEELPRILSWQKEEEFTLVEECDFLNK